MSDDEITLTIDGVEFIGWTNATLVSPMDSFASVEFSAPFEPQHKRFRDAFRPFSFAPCEVAIDGKRQFKGTIVDVAPDGGANKSESTIKAYSLPAVLNDCKAPASSVPLQFKKLGLREITKALTQPFGLDVDFRADEGSRFAKVKLSVVEKVYEFLIELAQQRGIVLGSTADGKLLCWQSVKPGSPVAHLRDDAPPLLHVSAKFSPQDYYSEVTGFARAKRSRKGSKYTALNPFLTAVLRPFSFQLDDTEKADAPAAAKAKLARMFAEVASYTAEVATWRDPAGKLWASNTTIGVHAPSAMIYSDYEFLIRSVAFEQTSDSRTASLELVMPGVFSGETPTSLPWSEA